VFQKELLRNIKEQQRTGNIPLKFKFLIKKIYGYLITNDLKS